MYPAYTLAPRFVRSERSPCARAYFVGSALGRNRRRAARWVWVRAGWVGSALLARCSSQFAAWPGGVGWERVIFFHRAFEKRTGAMCTHAAQAREPGPRSCDGSRAARGLLVLAGVVRGWTRDIAKPRAICAGTVINCGWLLEPQIGRGGARGARTLENVSSRMTRPW